MNPLTVDPVTGFLTSINPINNGFTADRKVEFLRIAKEYRDRTGKWPNFGSICQNLGISIMTLERHIKNDPKFGDEFRELTLGGKYQAESDMFNLRTKSPLFMFGWLRKWFPAEYNPEYRHNITVNTGELNAINGAVNQYVDAEVVNKCEELPVHNPVDNLCISPPECEQK
jgi:hypothetical protein